MVQQLLNTIRITTRDTIQVPKFETRQLEPGLSFEWIAFKVLARNVRRIYRRSGEKVHKPYVIHRSNGTNIVGCNFYPRYRSLIIQI